MGSSDERSANGYARRLVFFPGDLSQTNVGVGIGIVGAQFYDLRESLDGLRILELVEQGDAEVVPAHPFGVVGRVRGFRLVVADLEDAGARGNFDNRISWMILAEDVVEITLAQMAVVDLGGDRDGAVGSAGMRNW